MSTKPNPAPRSGPRAQAPVRRPVQTSARPVHFLLTDAYLVAANNGRHLTQLGFNALCRISRSAKDTMKQSSHQVEERLAKPEQLEAIRERWLDAFEANPERMARDATREAELAARLQDELLNELMRNANDAAAALLPNGRAMMLGRIGQGFRSVLSITDQPRVHSGDISFAFDPRRALKAIKKRLGRQTPAEIPVFRLPFPVSHKDEPAPIRAMIEEYDTVVVMPFRSLKACERCRAVWDAKRNDVTLLKSLPALNLMIWERNDATAHYKRTVRDNVDRSVRPAPRIQRPARVELTVGGANSNSKPVIDMSGPRSETDSRVMTRARPGPGVRVSAEIVRHPKNGSSANAPAKTNGAAAPAGRKSAKPKKTSTSAKTRNGTNGASSSSSKPKIETSATTARVAVSEKGTKSTAKKPAAKKPAAKKPAQKAAASHTKTKTAKATSAKKPAARKPATKKPAHKASATKTKTKTAKAPATRKPAAKKPAAKKPTARKPATKKPTTKKPAAKGKPTGTTKAAAAKKPASRRAPAKTRSAVGNSTKKASKSKASSKKP